MRFLIDTHVLIWAQDDPSQLPNQVTALLLDPMNDRLLSIVSCWEIAIKVELGKLKLSNSFRHWIDTARRTLILRDLGVTLEHLEALLNLPQSHHKDPFDRILCAQAVAEGLPIISNDPKLDLFGIARIWN